MTAPFLPEMLHGSSPADSSGERHGDTMAPGLRAATGLVTGTRVATPMGYVAVERLGAGDAVLTADGRHAKLVRVGMTIHDPGSTSAPVRLEIGTMDNMRPLRLGQGHRLFVSGWRAELLFGQDAVLVTAGSLVNGTDIRIDPVQGPLRYAHLMFDRPEIVLAENVACEALGATPDGLTHGHGTAFRMAA